MFNFLANDVEDQAEKSALNTTAPKVTIVYSSNWYVFILPY